jgi:Rad3-related DNA helicase
MVKKDIKISVRNIVEFVLRTGSIDNRFMSKTRAQEGVRAHQKLQKQNEREFSDYQKEVYMKHKFQFDKFDILVEGRADGIIKENEQNIIEEIKSTNSNLSMIDEEYNVLHWAQAKFYAYFYLLDNNLEDVYIQLSYYQLSTDEVKCIRKSYRADELREFVMSIVENYYMWAEVEASWIDSRNNSIGKVVFPFSNYRKGQRELAVAAYNTIKQKETLFVQAPTGIGKTISTIFPAIKALGEGLGDRIFYLTAKTITRTVAEEAFDRLRDKGLKCKSITITAKDKICFSKGSACNPDECSYAFNYYDKVNDAIRDLIANEDSVTRNIIEKYALKHEICPFEFSLDLTFWCDAIICDYNYAFDPKVYLRRFFEDIDENYIFLIDEAHNLVERSREMFSASIDKSKIMECKKISKGKSPGMYKALNSLNSYMIELRRRTEEIEVEYLVLEENPKDLYPLVRNFLKESDEYLIKSRGTEGYENILELYFELNSFIGIGENYDNGYISYIDCSNRKVVLNLFCIYPRNKMIEAMNRAKSKIIFSATLTPLNYFIDLLGGDENSYKLRLASPFERKNMNLNIATLSTRYKHREKNIGSIVEYIHKFVSSKVGNYIIFLPSYSFMINVYENFKNTYPDINTILQNGDMNEEDREVFLKKFDNNPDSTMVAFCVIGGVFSEGIDLTNDRLIGAAIVGVGLPQLCTERELIRNFFGDKDSGYDYSYTYPGMNKVLQAAGRVIRTEDDIGSVLLIDDRFTTNKYMALMPREWLNEYNIIKDPNILELKLKEFWGNKLN